MLQEQKDKHVNEIHQLPCLKRKFIHSALLCIWSVDKKKIRQTQCMELFTVTYQGGVLLPTNVIDGLQPLESVLMEPRSVVHKSAKGLVCLLRVGLLLSQRGGSREAQGTCKKHFDA